MSFGPDAPVTQMLGHSPYYKVSYPQALLPDFLLCTAMLHSSSLHCPMCHTTDLAQVITISFSSLYCLFASYK